MLPDRASNPGPLTYESGALPIAQRGPARCMETAVHGIKANDPHYFYLTLRQNTTSGEIKNCVYIFIYFTDFTIKLVYFLSIQSMLKVQISVFFVFFFLKMDPCLLERNLVFQIIQFLPELRRKNNVSVSKHKMLV